VPRHTRVESHAAPLGDAAAHFRTCSRPNRICHASLRNMPMLVAGGAAHLRAEDACGPAQRVRRRLRAPAAGAVREARCAQRKPAEPSADSVQQVASAQGLLLCAEQDAELLQSRFGSCACCIVPHCGSHRPGRCQASLSSCCCELQEDLGVCKLAVPANIQAP